MTVHSLIDTEARSSKALDHILPNDRQGLSERKPDWVDRVWRALCETLSAPLTIRARTDILALVVFAILPLLLATAPALFINDMILDVFIPLDGAWRVMLGQKPHIDFPTPIGDAYYAVLGLAGALIGRDPRILAVANLLVLPIVLAVGWVGTRSRLPTPLRLAWILFIVLLAISPRTLDVTGSVSFLASYNRYGWALAVAIGLLVLIEPEQRTRGQSVLESLVIAAVLIVLFYLKVTYLALAGVFLVTGLILARANRASIMTGGSAALIGICTLLLFHSGTQAYLEDLRAAAAANASGPGMIRLGHVVPALTANSAVLIATIIFLFGFSRSSRNTREEREASVLALASAAIVAAALAAATQSHDATVPALVLPLALGFAAVRKRAIVWQNPQWWGLRTMAVVLLAVLMTPVARDIQAIVLYAGKSRSADTAPLVSATSSPMANVRLPTGTAGDQKSLINQVANGRLPGFAYDGLTKGGLVAWNLDVPQTLDDALALLARHDLLHAKIATLGFSSPFPVVLGALPPRHMLAWFDYERTFSSADAPRVRKMFSDTNVVLVPAVWQADGLWDVSKETILREFDMVDQTPLWNLWVRRVPVVRE